MKDQTYGELSNPRANRDLTALVRRFSGAPADSTLAQSGEGGPRRRTEIMLSQAAADALNLNKGQTGGTAGLVATGARLFKTDRSWSDIDSDTLKTAKSQAAPNRSGAVLSGEQISGVTGMRGALRPDELVNRYYVPLGDSATERDNKDDPMDHKGALAFIKSFRDVEAKRSDLVMAKTGRREARTQISPERMYPPEVAPLIARAEKNSRISALFFTGGHDALATEALRQFEGSGPSATGFSPTFSEPPSLPVIRRSALDKFMEETDGIRSQSVLDQFLEETDDPALFARAKGNQEWFKQRPGGGPPKAKKSGALVNGRRPGTFSSNFVSDLGKRYFGK